MFLWFLLMISAPWCSQAVSVDVVSGQDVVSGKNTHLEPQALGSVVVFLSAKCPCSASHEPVLKDLAREFEPKGFRFIGVHSNADEALGFTQEHFKAAALPFSVIQDPQSKIADVFGALKTPHV